MFKFYAVDPSAISRDLNTTNAICNLFGFSKGHVIEVLTHKYYQLCVAAVTLNDNLRPNEKKEFLIKQEIVLKKYDRRNGRNSYNEILTF